MNSKAEILEQLREIFEELFEIEPEKVQLQANLYTDLDIDSIDAVDLVVRLKEITGKKIDLKINEINPSYYLFDCKAMFDALKRVERNPVSGEYYITDVPALLLESGERVEVIEAVPPADVLSINTLEQLAEVDRIMRDRLETAGSEGR